MAEALQWDDGQLRYTLEEIDGYHGSLELLHTITNNMHLFKKVMRMRLLEYLVFSAASHHITPCHAMPYHIISSQLILHRTASHHIVSQS